MEQSTSASGGYSPELLQLLEAAQERRFAYARELVARYAEQFPNAGLSEWFVFEHNLAERRCAPCANCDGTKCLTGYKSTFKVYENHGELEITNVPCKYAKALSEASRRKKNRSLSNIPAAYLGKSLADFNVTTDNRNAYKWAEKLLTENLSLYLFGSPGTGKTLLATIVAQEYLNQGKSVIFADVPTILDKLKGTFNDNSDETLDALMQQLQSVEVLVLDDLGTEGSTEWAVERMYLIVNNRYISRKQTIVTSNYTLDEVANRMNNPFKGRSGITGTRIASRLREMCKIAKISSEDYRRRR